MICPDSCYKASDTHPAHTCLAPWRAGKAAAIRLGWRQLPPKQSGRSPIPYWREPPWKGFNFIPLSQCSQQVITAAEARAASTQVVTVPPPQIIAGEGGGGTAPHAPLCTRLLPSHQAGLTPPPAKHAGKRLTLLISAAASGSSPQQGKRRLLAQAPTSTPSSGAHPPAATNPGSNCAPDRHTRGLLAAAELPALLKVCTVYA